MAVIRERRIPKQALLSLELPISTADEADIAVNITADYRLTEFEKIKILGHGSSGSVYQVVHCRTGAVYALKTISTHDNVRRCQVSREVEILLLTNSPTIVRCHAVFSTPSSDIALIMEHMDAGSLESVLAARGRRPFPEAALSAISRKVLLGLFYLHSHKIVHRDIKPGNLLANTAGEIKIADFSVSKIMRPTLDSCISYVGTCAYMSPERFDPNSYGGNYDAYSADVWSLGLTVLELHLGHFPLLPPGQRPDWATLMYAICFGEPPELPPTVSGDFRDFISRCLHKESTKRWSVVQLLAHPFVTGRDQLDSDQALNDLMIPS